MATKSLSGILVTRACPTGYATIDLDSNEIATRADGRPDASDGVELGKTRRRGTGRYRGEPCKIIALREIQIEVYHDQRIRDGDKIERQHLKINDLTTSDPERYMKIGWESSGRSEIEEISYMVVGDT